MPSEAGQGLNVFCKNHPDRRAIGVCVMTHQPICSECSTRYEGVNYSCEGLAMLKARRAEQQDGNWAEQLWGAVFVALWPGMIAMLYLFYLVSFRSLTKLVRWL